MQGFSDGVGIMAFGKHNIQYRLLLKAINISYSGKRSEKKRKRRRVAEATFDYLKAAPALPQGPTLRDTVALSGVALEWPRFRFSPPSYRCRTP